MTTTRGLRSLRKTAKKLEQELNLVDDDGTVVGYARVLMKIAAVAGGAKFRPLVKSGFDPPGSRGEAPRRRLRLVQSPFARAAPLAERGVPDDVLLRRLKADREEFDAVLLASAKKQQAAIERHEILSRLLPLVRQCRECRKYFVDLSGRKLRVYCNGRPRCGGRATARAAMRKRRAALREEPLQVARRAVDAWNRQKRRPATDWKVWVVRRLRREGITVEWVTRAVNSGRLQPPR